MVWRGTTQDMEWINVFGAVQADASRLIIAKSLKELKGGNKDDKGMTHETRNLSKVMHVFDVMITHDNYFNSF